MGATQSKKKSSITSTASAASSLPVHSSLFTPNQWQSSSTTISRNTTLCEEAPPPPPPLEDGGTPPPPPPDDSIASAAQTASKYTNPGPYEMAAMDGKRLVQLETFDGFRCDINKQLSPYMAVIHSFLLGTTSSPDGRPSTYTFVSQVADEQGILMTRVDPGRGSVDGRIHRAVLGGLGMAKLQLSMSPDGGGNDQALCEFDFGGLSWTANLKYGSMGGGTVYGGNYFQCVTPKLVMGGEAMYVGVNQSLVSNYTLKYSMPAKTGDEGGAVPMPPKKPTGPDTAGLSQLCVNYNASQAALTFNYKRVVTPNRVTLGAELMCNPLAPTQQPAQLLVGAEFKLTRSRFAVCVDGGLHTQALLEAKLGVAPGSPTLQFSADVDHFKDAMKFGYGLTVEG